MTPIAQYRSDVELALKAYSKAVSKARSIHGRDCNYDPTTIDLAYHESTADARLRYEIAEDAAYNQREEDGTVKFDYKKRRDAIVEAAYNAWTDNGLGLDLDASTQAVKTVQDAVNNSHVDGISNRDWLAASLKRLRGE